jgi:uridine phosphorylase
VTEPAPIHLRPAAELAERVLLPGDPHRAMAVAQALTDQPQMFNHARGLWGYTGLARDGLPLTVQSTGIGGPSAAIVIEELISLGARTLIRIGTCGALTDGFELGELVTAERVLAADGPSAALGAGPELTPDPALTAALVGRASRPVTAVSTDVFYDPREEAGAEWVAAGAQVVEMEAATLIAVAERRGAAAAVVLAVTDLLEGGGRQRIEGEPLEAAGVALGEAAWAALAATDRSR